MKKVYLLLLGLVFASSSLFAGNYTLDNEKVDNLFDAATEITVSGLDLVSNNVMSESGLSISGANDTQTTILIAWIVDWFVGGFGIHRYVLGTKGSMWAIYTFTVCGIFGIVPVIDWFVLLIDGLILGNGSKYTNNDQFFMWI